LVLYLIPSFIFIFMIGIEHIANRLEKFFPKTSSYIAIGVVVMISFSFFNGFEKSFPVKNMEIKQLISYMNNNIGDDDMVYVNGTSVNSFKYYQQIGLVKFDNKVHLGSVRYELLNLEENIDQDIVRLESEVANLIPGRYWLVFTQYSLRKDEEIILNYINSNNFKKMDDFYATGASIHLYDLKKTQQSEVEQHVIASVGHI
jgi:hypothetical protein